MKKNGWNFGWFFAFALAGSAFAGNLNAEAVRPAGGDWPPVIGAWFWSRDVLEPDGFKPFLDAAAVQSPYTLLSTACRCIEVTEPAMHEQAAKAVRYANTLGLKIALEVDIRLARQAFRAKYPDEQQEELVLKRVDFPKDGPAEAVFQGVDTSDHMNGSLPKYECLTTRLVRVYAFAKGPDGGIDPATVKDITGEGVVATVDGPRKLTVRVPAQPGRSVCVIASHTVLTPDIFAPHFFEFQRGIIGQYADVPLAGIMKDEWGFPPDHTGNPEHDRYWYSKPMGEVYAQLSGGRDLVRDALLMCAGETGRGAERAVAINRYRKLCRERNVAIEDDFYRAGKATFGKDAFIVTHSTWIPYPGAQEFRKNGLSWWDATRDMGQSDETTPYPCRTALAKRWGYPVWYNQFYAKETTPYVNELWSGALSGGRLNVHPLYPRPDLARGERDVGLMRSGLMAGMTRLRMLDFVTRAPLACPAAVVFGHACAMNWTQPSYNNVGLGVASALCAKGYPADLIPSSLVASKALKIDAEGYVCLGPQRYQAVVLYEPEFGDEAELAFFSRAAAGKSALFLVGDWTRDFEARPLDAKTRLGTKVQACADDDACAAAVVRLLGAAGVERVTEWVPNAKRWGSSGGALATPPAEGHSVLIDKTYVRIAGSKNAAGDPIAETFAWQGHSVAVDAIGVVAIRFAADGQVAAFAAGGLKSVKTDGLDVALPERTDLAFVRSADGRIRGVVQGLAGPLPKALQALAPDWERLCVPLPADPLAKDAEKTPSAFPAMLFTSEPAKKIQRYDASGKVVWEFPAETARDVWQLPNGNVLFPYSVSNGVGNAETGAMEVTPDKRIVWQFKTHGQVYSCQRMKDGNTLVGATQQGKLLIVNPAGEVVKSFAIKNAAAGHGSMRNVRALADGHFLVAEESARAAREYAADGQLLREFKTPFPTYSAIRLPSGNTVTCGKTGIVEFDAAGTPVWELKNTDVPELGIRWFAGLQVLPNGNFFICNAGGKVPFAEISHAKKIVWQCDPAKIQSGIGHGIQRLDIPGEPLK